MYDIKKRYIESYGRNKLQKQGTVTIISNHAEKVLTRAFCAGCGMSGMAYEDPSNQKQEPHFCIVCKGAKV